MGLEPTTTGITIHLLLSLKAFNDNAYKE